MSHLVENTTLFQGKYRITSVLGQGGFGITYKAENTLLQKAVVIKEFFMRGESVRTEAGEVRLPNFHPDDYEKFKQKFLEEARLLARFGHNAYIVNVEDYFEENGTAYFVMPFLEGMSLGEFVKRQPNNRLSEADTIKIARQLEIPLKELHQHGILHRDIKPDNVIITNKGSLVLIDFGSAREYLTNELGEKFSVLLTPGYAPPEQYDSLAEKAPYTDIYALGALLYRLLTGVVPPPAPERKQKGLTPPKNLNPEISDNTNDAIMKCMALEPIFRFQAVSGFIYQLMQGQQKNEPAPPPPPPVQEEPKPEKVEPPKVEKEKPETPPPPPMPDLGENLRQRADAFFKQQQFEKALTLYEGLFLENPSDTQLKVRVQQCKAAIQKKEPAAVENPVPSAFRWKYFWIGFAVFVVVGIGVGFLIGKLSEKKGNFNEPEMVFVGSGQFLMGSRDKSGEADEKPSHSVQLDAFYIGKTEVTNRQWRYFCQETNRTFPKDFPKNGLEDYPVTNITRKDAIEYCEWLSKKTKQKYRLPTEAEWEYAARGGGKSQNFIYSGSNYPTKVAWFNGFSLRPVMRKNPNELGLYDMSGGVWEWCSDYYSKDYYQLCYQLNKRKPADNPLNRIGNMGVLRGGDYRSSQADIRCTNRLYSLPNVLNSNDVFGVRVVKEIGK